MTPDQLRALAETLEHECALRLIAGGKNHEEAQACEQAANYLRACADNQPYETERWNVERQSDGSLLVCFNRHERGEKCEYEHFVPAPAAPQAEPCVGNDPPSRGHAFTITEGTPTKSGATRWCCYCGKARKVDSDGNHRTN